VADVEGSTREGVDRRAISTAVVGEHAFDGDTMPTVESDGSAEETRGGRCFLIVEHLCVGKAAVVVDGDVDALP